MRKLTKMACLVGLVAAWAGLAWAASAPQVIPFQGRLTDQNGTAYSEGAYTILFNLYDAPVGGTSLWTERHTGVRLVNGMVNVFLGSIVPLDEQDFTQTRYLGITIDADGNANTADPEMVPRQMIVPAFFAKDSESLRGADWSAILAKGATDPRTNYIDGARIASKTVKAAQLADKNVTTAKLADRSVTGTKIATNSILPEHLAAATLGALALPPGVIMPFAGPTNNIPKGWLLCDGAAVSSEDYPILYATIGTTWGSETNITGNGVTYFNLPNFSNRTLWGANTHAVGEYIEAGLPDHHHRYQQAAGDSGFGYAGVGYFGGWNLNTMSVAETASLEGTTTLYGKSDTVQPPAASVNFIIKVDSTY